MGTFAESWTMLVQLLPVSRGAWCLSQVQHTASAGFRLSWASCGLWLTCPFVANTFLFTLTTIPLDRQPNSLAFFFFFNIYLFIIGYTGSLLLCGLSLVVESGAHSLVVVHRLLFAVVSLVEHRL